MCEFPIKSPRWIWTALIALVACTFVVHLHAFTLDEECSTSCTGQYNIWKVFNTISKTCKCRSCSTCTEEHGLSVKCNTVITQKVSLECIKCVPGVNYSSDSNTEQCQPCQSTLCLENEIVNGKCTPGKDTTTCTGICEQGYSINSDRTRCVLLSIVGDNNTTLNVTDVPVHSMNTDKTKSVHLNISGGDNTTLNLMVVPVQNSPSIKPESQSASDSLIAVKIVCPAVLFILIIAVVYWCYRQSHSRNQVYELASENAVELGDSGATPSTCNVIKDQETEALIQNPDEENGQLQSPNFGEAFLSLNSSPQETPPTDSELTTTGIENEPVAVHNTCGCRTPCLDVEPGTTARDENQPVAVSNTDETPCLDVETRTTAEDENQPVAVHNTCGCRTPCLDVEPGTTARDENQPVAVDNTDETPCLDVETGTTAEDENHSSVIGDLNENVYREVCKRLNLGLPDKDWRNMAGLMGFSNNDVRYIAEYKKNNPTDAVLQDWGTKDGNDVRKLITILKGMGRDDVVKILEVDLGIRPSSGVEEESY